MVKQCSLKVRLLRLLLIPLGISFLVVGGLSFFAALRETREMDDGMLISQAKIISALVIHEVEEDEPTELKLLIDSERLDHRYERNLSYRVWFKDELILQSPKTENFPPTPAPIGFSSSPVEGAQWRFFALADERHSVITEVAEPTSLRITQGLPLMAGLFGPQLVLLPILIVLVSIGVSVGLAPMEKLSSQVAARSAEDLTPLSGDIIPAEASSLVGAVNGLMERLGAAISRERTFTDNAAHELRTPLAAIKTQAQLATRASNSDERNALLTDLVAGVDRASHMLGQMLSLARLDSSLIAAQVYDFSSVVETCTAQLGSVALRKGVALSVDIAPGLHVKGHPEAGAQMVRNIIENAVKFSPRGTGVTVTLRRGEQQAVLTVEDCGPGIPENKQNEVFERFVRIAQAGQPGSGLGLSIVKRAVALHEGTVTLSNRDSGPGLQVKVTLRLS